MIEPQTPNTQAILLLTAPLLVGRREITHDLLSLGDYNRLALLLRQRQKPPAALIDPNAQELIEDCAVLFGRERLEGLLGRGFLLSQAIERWSSRSIWVISRADADYPKRLKWRLKEMAPPLLYGCGDITLLDEGGLAVVGSRNVDEEVVEFTENVGRFAAEANRSVVSGGAKGIDRAAMHGALMAGGAVAGVMADSLEKAALARDNREPLMDGRLVLISPYDPAAGFNVGNAMQRNKLIYALADAALVVTSDLEKGGTWAGAIEQLDRLHFVPVFVRNGDKVGKGNFALLNRGGKPWPNPTSGEELAATLASAAENVQSSPVQDNLPLVLQKEPVGAKPTSVNPEREPASPAPAPVATNSTPTSEMELWNRVREILLRELVEARSEEDVAALLGINKTQAKAWLARLTNEKLIEKVKKSHPVRFRVPTEFELPLDSETL